MSCEFLFPRCKVNLRVANLNKYFYELQVVCYELKKSLTILKILFYELSVTSWKFKMIKLQAECLTWQCLQAAKLAFPSWTFTMTILRITNTYLNQIFKGINLRKLSEEAILINCILTLDNLNTQ